MYTIEWQKARTTLAHMLVWLQETLHVLKVDDFISAEYRILKKTQSFQLHYNTNGTWSFGVINPFSPCMKNGRCTKGYPRDF
ncbi:hypothetical protein TNCT_595661 [Trichonephila clavata]|uniref:Uncharacterized protein n=1 Tax=Trichonephila clavata TaxID=2740835 RepID=A0A8X6H2B4_TRICU|nr:hypothetical protein TNCT_595661 [Trichonephila clavata]